MSLNLVLQVWGGVTYTLNKVFLAFANGPPDQPRYRHRRVLGWFVFLVGIPAWVAILALKHDWMVAALEAGGIPAVLLGLFTSVRGVEPTGVQKRWVDRFTYLAVLTGVCYSGYTANGQFGLSHLLELGSLLGYLIGSNLLAKDQRAGWGWFMLMNGSMGLLMGLQDKPILAVQQLVSFGFDLYGLRSWGRARRTSSSVRFD